jgi:transketolase
MAKLASLREVYGNTLVKLGKTNKNIIVLDADLAFSTKTYLFKLHFPERFFDMGIAEADMMATAAGLASCGKIVFASTFAVFATGRAWDQIRLAIAYSNLSVKIVASHGGVATGMDGYSHQAIEDIALMRVIPNMRVIVPSDGTQVEEIIEKITYIEGPFYVRLIKPPLPILYEKYKFEIGKGIVIEEGREVVLGAIGSMVHEAIKGGKILKEKYGIKSTIIDFVSVKPIDEELILKTIQSSLCFVTCEDHSIIGGLGDAVGEVILKTPKLIPLLKIGIPDGITKSGTPEELYKNYRLTGEEIAERVFSFMKALQL